MKKRGQVTVIVIVAIVIVFAFAFVYFAREGYIQKVIRAGDVSKRLELVFDSIKNEQIYPCINSEMGKALRIIGENGGYLNSVDTAMFYGQRFTVLCKPVLNEKNKCARSILDIRDLEERLSRDLSSRISDCIDLSAYRGKDYNLNTGDLKADVKIGDKNIAVDIDYPVSVSKGVVNFNASDFVYNVDVPLGEIAAVANDILNSESAGGYFPAYLYSLSKPRYDIRKIELYPKRFYVITDSEKSYIFRFAVEGWKE